ncbi:hypothetical protein BHE74_00030481 [Ensete ventricosum]|nr:hypothetical protein BHE74_00030481 [Ensete ventricosum]
MKLFFQIVCGATCDSKPLTTAEWYLVFTCLAVVLSQLPNLNSIAGVSLIGSVTAVTYCTLIWVISVSKGRLPGVSYHPVEAKSQRPQSCSGDPGDVTLLLQLLLSSSSSSSSSPPSSSSSSSSSSGDDAVKSEASFPGTDVERSEGSIPDYSILLVPHSNRWFLGLRQPGKSRRNTLCSHCSSVRRLLIHVRCGWQIPSNGMLTALYAFHGTDTSRVLLGLTALLVVVNCLSCFQIYAMPIFDSMEAGYTKKKNRPCPRWLRSAFRAFFAAVSYFMAVAFPFLSDLAGLIGGMALPVTLAYPCFMWILVKKPERYSAIWYINWVLGCAGMVLSLILTIAGVWNLVKTGIDLRFFKPQ